MNIKGEPRNKFYDAPVNMKTASDCVFLKYSEDDDAYRANIYNLANMKTSEFQDKIGMFIR